MIRRTVIVLARDSQGNFDGKSRQIRADRYGGTWSLYSEITPTTGRKYIRVTRVISAPLCILFVELLVKL